ncbi:hypothetical protein POTOM_060786 [Populus tomentosa]|uniref:Uncharacterized protein n=1 Tax=Populus tomentosa TaxID=118781 RepID=A0A8X7XR41_POPTO|nr:hypothetical protein POTOM_060786 [Populus tomentosa]
MNGHGEEEQQTTFEIYVVVAKRNVEEEDENCDCIEFLMKELRNVGFIVEIDSRSPPRGSPISTLVVPIKALEGFSPPLPASQVLVTDVVSLTKTLDSMNSVVPGASSTFGVERQALDGCPGFLAGHNMNFTQRTLVVASPQPALSSF